MPEAAASFNTHVNNTTTSSDALFCLSASVSCFSLTILPPVFKQLQVEYWTTLKAGFDTELFVTSKHSQPTGLQWLCLEVTASLLKAFLVLKSSPFSQWWTLGLMPQALFQLLPAPVIYRTKQELIAPLMSFVCQPCTSWIYLRLFVLGSGFN